MVDEGRPQVRLMASFSALVLTASGLVFWLALTSGVFGMWIGLGVAGVGFLVWSGAVVATGGIAMAIATPPTYPVTFDVEYPERLSRWLIFVKWLLAIPHIIILYALQIVRAVVTLIAFFVILFTKRYPRELFDFTVNVNRWSANVAAYTLLMRDEYPPFSWDEGIYAVQYGVEYPEELSRWLIFVKWLLAIPHYIVLLFLGIGLYFVLIVAFFAILFTKRYPESLFSFAVGVQRWQYRVDV